MIESLHNSSNGITRQGKSFQELPGFVEPGYLCTSERDSENVDTVCKKFNWKPLYYFFHGWAALDWYRGYDQNIFDYSAQ
jgi:hypothetical protein